MVTVAGTRSPQRPLQRNGGGHQVEIGEVGDR